MENSIPEPSPFLPSIQEMNKIFQYFGKRYRIQVLGISENNNLSITDFDNIRVNLSKIVAVTDGFYRKISKIRQFSNKFEESLEESDQVREKVMEQLENVRKKFLNTRNSIKELLTLNFNSERSPQQMERDSKESAEGANPNLNELEAFKKKSEDLQIKMGILVQEMNGKEIQIKEMNDRNTSLEEETQRLKEEANKKKILMEKQQEEISCLKSKSIDEIRKKEILIEEKQQEISGLTSNINDLQENIKKLLQDLEKLKLEKEQVQNEKNSLETKIEEKKLELEHTLECYKELEKKYNNENPKFKLKKKALKEQISNQKEEMSKMTEEEILDYFTTMLKRINVDLVDFSSITFSKKDLIGKGGNGKVYKGLFLKSAVAIKEYTNFNVLEDYQNDEEVSFFIELMNNFKLNVPKTNRCYGISLDSRGTVYSIHELAVSTLKKKLEEKLDLREKISLTDEILTIMLYLEKQKIAHRDLKPENILIDNNNEIQLCDFGSLRKIKSANGETETENTTYTVRYAPPEFISDANILGLYSDIWSVGAIIYYIFTGRDVWFGKKDDEIKENIKAKQVPIIEEVNEFPKKIIEMIKKAMVINGKDRISITEMKRLFDEAAKEINLEPDICRKHIESRQELQQSLKDKKSKIEEQEKQLQNYESQLKDVLQTVDQLKKSAQEKEDELSRCKERTKSIEEELRNSEEKLRNSEEISKELQKRNIELETNLKKSRIELIKQIASFGLY